MVESSDRIPTQYGDNWWSGVVDPLRGLTSKVADFFAPSAEAADSKDAYDICIELPGVLEKDINVSVDHSTLTVSGEKNFEKTEEGKTYFFSERSYGRFQRSFRLPANADAEHIDACFKDGVLEILIAKKAANEDTRTIKVRKA
jgi:HSP20 family protein